MFILTHEGEEESGAFSVANAIGDKVLYIFEEEDDAERYAMQLTAEGYPEMCVMDVDAEVIFHVCEMNEHEYTIITPDDIVVPPKLELYDQL